MRTPQIIFVNQYKLMNQQNFTSKFLLYCEVLYTDYTIKLHATLKYITPTVTVLMMIMINEHD
jgi:hypothetical protein